MTRVGQPMREMENDKFITPPTSDKQILTYRDNKDKYNGFNNKCNINNNILTQPLLVDYEGSDNTKGTDPDMPDLTEDEEGDDQEGGEGEREHRPDPHALSPGTLDNMTRQDQINWVVGRSSSCEILGMAHDRQMWEDVQQNAAMARIFREAKIFKVQSQTNKHLKTDRYMKMYDINRYFKVSQKLAGHRALKVDSLKKAKRLS